MKKVVLFFVLAAICWLATVISFMRFVQSIKEIGDSNLATIEAPGSAFFPVEVTGKVSLWHNYEDVHGGEVIHHEPQIPHGFAFELKEMSSGVLLPFTPAFADVSTNNGPLSKKGLGSFEITTPGDYELSVTTPPGDSRIISLSKGGFFNDIGKVGFPGLIAAFSGVLGLIFLIIAILLMILNSKARKRNHPPSPPPPHAP